MTRSYIAFKKKQLADDKLKIGKLPKETLLELCGGTKINISKISELQDIRIANLTECEALTDKQVLDRMNGIVRQLTDKAYENRHGDCKLLSMEDFTKVSLVCDMENIIGTGV